MAIAHSARSVFSLVSVGVTLVAAGAIAVACSSSGPTNAFNGGADGGDETCPPEGCGGQGFGNADAMQPSDAAIAADAFWAKDPPPMWCGADGSGTPPQAPGGTPDCPSDKNRQGCPCPTVGETAACWPGLRANRGLGQCKDGTTTCSQINEATKAWGPCQNYVLPASGVTKGAAACRCFSAGAWKLANVSPCFAMYGSQMYAVSTFIDASGKAQCPTGSSPPPPQPEPGKSWTNDTLKVDCAGHFKLCMTLKAGNAMSPQPADCVVTQVCTEADYTTPGADQTFPDLPGWSSSDSACATSFANGGGYAEMSVIGQSVRCDAVDDGHGQPEVFQRNSYCPLSCSQPNPPAMCSMCSQGGGGGF